jgi:FtsP/CotA-like multicopper oxidase with cupredoxin domain
MDVHHRANSRVHQSIGLKIMLKPYLATLLLALPVAVAMVPVVAYSTRTIEISLSNGDFPPMQIEGRRGERVRLILTSTDDAHAVHVEELGVRARVPAGGQMVIDVMPSEAATFEIECADCGSATRP